MCYCNVTVDPSWHPDIGKVERTDTRNEGKLSMLLPCNPCESLYEVAC